MKISFELSLEDMVAYSMFYVKKTPAGRKAMLRSRLVMALIFALLVIMDWLVYSWKTPNEVLVQMLIVSAAFYFAWPFVSKFKARRVWRKLAAAGELDLDEEIVMEFEEEHFSKTMPEAMRRMRYSIIRRVNVEKEYIYITLHGRQIMTLPRRAMADHGEALIGLLKEKCGADKVV